MDALRMSSRVCTITLSLSMTEYPVPFSVFMALAIWFTLEPILPSSASRRMNTSLAGVAILVRGALPNVRDLIKSVMVMPASLAKFSNCFLSSSLVRSWIRTRFFGSFLFSCCMSILLRGVKWGKASPPPLQDGLC